MSVEISREDSWCNYNHEARLKCENELEKDGSCGGDGVEIWIVGDDISYSSYICTPSNYDLTLFWLKYVLLIYFLVLLRNLARMKKIRIKEERKNWQLESKRKISDSEIFLTPHYPNNHHF